MSSEPGPATLAAMSLRIGKLSLPPPRIVGSITQAATLSQADAAGDWPCEIVEVRLDKVGVDTPRWLEQSKTLQANSRPVIFTLRTAAEGGEWRRPERERLMHYTLALENLAAVDVEWQSVLIPKLAGLARTLRKVLIVSAHDFVKTPSLNALRATVMEASRGASLVKIATLITKPADVDTLRELLAEDWGVPLCVMGMGPLGEATRTLFPPLGSMLTYGYLDEAAAPGQPSAADLVSKLR